ncbi:4Fe-4S ferredoxin [Acetobacter estunensis NRIC 0472]|nr:ferredoxin family protein [Acetobacter estunensis]GBQ25682.1 4Fe-4S ferredoxin [Acetobacter estunensis NRIC 0472]
MSGIETTGNRERAMSTPKCLEEGRTGLVVPIVDFNRCEGKDACVAVCPYNVFEVRKIDRSDYRELSFVGKIKSHVHGGMVAYTPHADQCRACGLCVKACPERAIKLVKV